MVTPCTWLRISTFAGPCSESTEDEARKCGSANAKARNKTQTRGRKGSAGSAKAQAQRPKKAQLCTFVRNCEANKKWEICLLRHIY